ncbi:hypothetical protein LV716_01260 [Flagellimonas sp. HMM57]|nr:hypothetical protein [Flagellimonas sp. HMM57]UII76442.1 hypothetical protein LV716_01260 [Flagellimonas sp. HMM57]
MERDPTEKRFWEPINVDNHMKHYRLWSLHHQIIEHFAGQYNRNKYHLQV